MLALIALGLAAMPTNSHFQLPIWVPIIFFVAAGIMFLWVAVELLAGRKQQQTEFAKVEPDLIIGANIQKIITYGNGTKKLTANIKLKPGRPVTVDILSLYLWGERYEAKTWKEYDDKPGELISVTPITITDPSSYIVFFYVPEESAINSEDVKIYAFANNKEYYSEPFGIKFEASLRHEIT